MISSTIPLVEVSGLTVREEEATILDDVSLAISPGRLHALAGANGAGKSTLLSAMLGRIPFSGSIRFHFRASRRIGVVPQRFAVDRALPMTALDFLVLRRQRRPVCLGHSRAARQRSLELLARAGLADHERRAIGALSGGEMQRLLFVNAIDPQPELLLLDEPSSAMDSAGVEWMERELLALVRESGTTVVIVSHDRAQIDRLAGEITTLERGRVRREPPASARAVERCG